MNGWQQQQQQQVLVVGGYVCWQMLQQACWCLGSGAACFCSRGKMGCSNTMCWWWVAPAGTGGSRDAGARVSKAVMWLFEDGLQQQ
jgi:hypothetical protein